MRWVAQAWIGFALGVMVCAPGACGQTAPAPLSLWGELGAGKYGVGFRTFSFSLKSASGGAMQVALWYPAAAGTESRRMTYADYLRISSDLGPDAKQFATDEASLRRTLGVLISGKEASI